MQKLYSLSSGSKPLSAPTNKNNNNAHTTYRRCSSTYTFVSTANRAMQALIPNKFTDPDFPSGVLQMPPTQAKHECAEK